MGRGGAEVRVAWKEEGLSGGGAENRSSTRANVSTEAHYRP